MSYNDLERRLRALLEASEAYLAKIGPRHSYPDTQEAELLAELREARFALGMEVPE